MKQLLITIAAVVLVGCGPSVDVFEAARDGNIEAVKQHLAAGTDVNAKDNKDETPLNIAYISDQTEIADLLSKLGGKTGFQLQSSGN